MKIILLVLFFLSVNTQSNFPNIQYLGRGYNILQGNPHDNGIDRGFGRNNVFQFIYNGSLTGDRRYFVPYGMDGTVTLSCSHRAQSTEISGESSYFRSLKQDVKTEFSGWGVAFSASVSYKNLVDEKRNHETKTFHSTVKCIAYDIYVNDNIIPLTDSFRERIINLRTISHANELIKEYGTHYVISAYMGAKDIIESKMTKENLELLKQESVNVEVAASFSYLSKSGSFSSMTDYEKKEAEKFQRFESTYHRITIGANPPNQPNPEESWYPKVREDPYPMEYSLSMISNLIHPKYFPGIPVQELNEKKGILVEALYTYCGHLDNCSPMGSEWVETNTYTQAVSGNGQKEVKCKGYDIAVGCGTLSGSIDSGAFISGYNTCRCKHGSSGTCYSNCIKNFEPKKMKYESRRFGPGSVDVSCPNGFFLTSCGFDGNSNEPFSNFYPKSRSTCTCTSNIGGTCYATCSQGVFLYEQKSFRQAGGDVTLDCGERREVLGCHIQRLGGSTGYFASPVSRSRCVCRSSVGFVCHAICGRVITSMDEDGFFEYRRTSYRTHSLEKVSGNRFKIQEHCKKRNDCVGYTSDGFLKGAVPDVSEWNIDDPNVHLYVRDFNRFKQEEKNNTFIDEIVNLD